jgi:hypothetical protein
MKIIACGLKILGKSHVQAMLDAVEHASSVGCQLVVGFDMVNEEDYNDPIDTFIEQMFATKVRMGTKF